MSPETFKKVRALADQLIASCDGGREHWDEIEALSFEETTALNTMALECTTCNQWFTAVDMHENGFGEYVCADCE